MRATAILLLLGLVGVANPCAAQVAPGPGAAASALGSGIGVSNVVVRPGDVLQIQIWPDKELGGDFPIEETGLVYLPVLGAVQVGGLGIIQIRSELRARYAQSMKDPVVVVVPLVRISVIGAVARPGVYMAPPTESAVDVILRAGGFNETADQERIEIVRGGQSIAVHTDQAIRAIPGASLTLESNDWILVPARKKGLSISSLNIVLQLVSIGTLFWSVFKD
jgi:protein involved in polysaccharide export with SLBB domain